MCRNKIKIFILVVMVALGSTGCWDSVSIEKKDITTTVLVDKTADGYAFYAEIASIVDGGSRNGGQSGNPKSRMIHAQGPSFADVREGLERRSDHPVYLGGVQSLIFTEKYVHSGIDEYMYRFRQNPDYRKTSSVAVTAEDPEELFKFAPENNVLLGRTIDETIQSLVDVGQLYRFTAGDVLEAMSCTYKGYLLPRIALKDQDIVLEGFCVMYGGTCIGSIPMEESESIVYIRGNAPPFRYAMPYKENSVTVELRLKKNSTKVSYIDGQIRMELNFICKAQILYMDDTLSLDEAALQEIKQALEKQLTDNFTGIIETSQKKFKCDYLRFHEAFRIRYPDEFKEMDWGQEYPKVEITVDIAVNIQNSNIDYEPKS